MKHLPTLLLYKGREKQNTPLLQGEGWDEVKSAGKGQFT